MSGHTVSDEDWARALECAMSCLHGIPITAAELDNAMQHAFGMLSLSKASAVTNSHAELVKALESALNELDYIIVKHGYVTTEWTATEVRAALAKATPSRNQVERSAS